MRTFALAVLLIGYLTAPLAAETPKYAIAIHGGAGGDPARWTPKQRTARKAALTRVLKLGVGVLEGGGSSLDAVERVIRELEDDPIFNAGRGAVLNSEGGAELDASIMDGRTKACGAVASVRIAKNPISLARLVMTETRHVLLAAHGADRFAEEMKVDLVDNDYFRTDAQIKRWKAIKAKEQGTVGCVALDSHGNLAAGTSTGGLMNKKYGRVGDSPIIGAGTYADNRTCAVSCTGVGEHYIRHAIAHDVSARMEYKQQSLRAAAHAAMHKTLKPGMGGIIAVDKDGNIALDFNTAGMSRAAADANGKWIVELGSRKPDSR